MEQFHSEQLLSMNWYTYHFPMVQMKFDFSFELSQCSNIFHSTSKDSTIQMKPLSDMLNRTSQLIDDHFQIYWRIPSSYVIITYQSNMSYIASQQA